MPNHFQKSLQECLPKIKKPNPQVQLPLRSTLSSSTSWIFRGCKQPRSASFAIDDEKENRKQEDGNYNHNSDASASLSDIDRFLLENFKSLYKNEDDAEDSDHSPEREQPEGGSGGGGVLIESPGFMDPPENLRGSHRFFVGLGISSSLMEEARRSLTFPSNTTEEEEMGSSSSIRTSSSTTFNDSTTRTSDLAKESTNPDDFITVLTYSPNPYEDFKKSMQEMVEARLNHNGRIDWEFMEELLFCFLNLNDKKSYRYILRAFVDIIVVLRENSGKVVRGKSKNVRN